MTDRERKAGLLSRVPFFAGFEPADREHLAAGSRLQHAAEGDAVVEQGAVGTTLFVIESGRVKIETHTPPADPVILDVLGPGEVFGELALLTRRPRSAHVVAIEPSVFLCLDHRDLRAAIERSPAVALALLDNLATRIVGLGELVRSFAVSGLGPRLARRICALAASHGTRDGDGVRLDLPLTQREWALLSGASREAVNRQFRVWAERDLVKIEGGSLLILNLEALHKLADAAGLFGE